MPSVACELQRILEEADRLFVQVESAPAISEYEKEQRAVKAHFERHKAERLARERGNQP
jgi:hypothetical protein